MSGCGYTSIYKGMKNQNFQIIVDEMQGDREINNLIKNQINLYSNKDSLDKFIVSLETKYEKLVIAKDTNGTITDYKLSVNSKFIINFNEKSKNINFEENINIKNQSNTFEQNLYEKNVKKNFASTIREKLISEIINLK